MLFIWYHSQLTCIKSILLQLAKNILIAYSKFNFMVNKKDKRFSNCKTLNKSAISYVNDIVYLHKRLFIVLLQWCSRTSGHIIIQVQCCKSFLKWQKSMLFFLKNALPYYQRKHLYDNKLSWVEILIRAFSLRRFKRHGELSHCKSIWI